MTEPKNLFDFDKYPNWDRPYWNKRFNDVPSCSTAVVTMFLAYATYVPAHTTGQLKKLKQLSIYIFCVVYAPQRQC